MIRHTLEFSAPSNCNLRKEKNCIQSQSIAVISDSERKKNISRIALARNLTNTNYEIPR